MLISALMRALKLPFRHTCVGGRQGARDEGQIGVSPDGRESDQKGRDRANAHPGAARIMRLGCSVPVMLCTCVPVVLCTNIFVCSCVPMRACVRVLIWLWHGVPVLDSVCASV
eukprot:6178176-Pleurochrysis_carterae.AAC.2